MCLFSDLYILHCIWQIEYRNFPPSKLLSCMSCPFFLVCSSVCLFDSLDSLVECWPVEPKASCSNLDRDWSEMELFLSEKLDEYLLCSWFTIVTIASEWWTWQKCVDSMSETHSVAEVSALQYVLWTLLVFSFWSSEEDGCCCKWNKCLCLCFHMFSCCFFLQEACACFIYLFIFLFFWHVEYVWKMCCFSMTSRSAYRDTCAWCPWLCACFFFHIALNGFLSRKVRVINSIIITHPALPVFQLTFSYNLVTPCMFILSLYYQRIRQHPNIDNTNELLMKCNDTVFNAS
jgi:hypothetical protein